MNARVRFLALCMALLLPALATTSEAVAAAAESVVPVCATCAYTTIDSALAAAQPGATVQVRGGRYRGPLVVTVPVRLEGRDGATIDGAGAGTVVWIRADDTTLTGFTVRDSGSSFDREDSGILVEGARARISDNQILNSLFGLYLKKAPDAVAERNRIVGKHVAEPLRGDGLKIWYSDRALIRDNQIADSRDGLVWFSKDTVITGNTIERGRYGLHFMYSMNASIERNQVLGNSVGIYIMFGKSMTVRGNLLRDSRGPSGHGLGLKDVDGALIEDNSIVDNRVGVYIDNSPFSTDVYNYFRRNLIAFNTSGLAILPANRNSVFANNSFIENVEQVTVLGGGRLGATAWSEQGRGNFWSDYAGYDGNGDGVGDVAYRSARLSELLMDREPLLQLFRFSVAATAADFAARAVPVFQPEPKLVDRAPLVRPVRPASIAAPAGTGTRSTLLAGLGLLLVAMLVPGVAWRGTRTRRRVLGPPETGAVVELRGVSKHYGKSAALDKLSLTIGAGEALALWGRNGAGKTTVLRCLLGLTSYEGEISVGGLSPRRAGARVRRSIGYVPQEMPTFDLPVGELAELIARLRGVDTAQATRQLERFGLAASRHKAIAALSGGMKQKLALALALVGDPPILLLDEPTANLDAASQTELLNLLLALKQEGRTLIFTSHRWHEVTLLADRVVGLERGRTIAVTQPTDLAATGGAAVRLRVRLGASLLDAASDVLQQHGFTAHRNGSSLLVRVEAGRKAEPFVLLAREGYPVTDFDVEHET